MHMEHHLKVLPISAFHAGTGERRGQGWEGFGFCVVLAPLVLCLGHRQHKQDFPGLFKLQVSDLSSLFFPLAPGLRLLWVPKSRRKLFVLGCRKGLGRAEMNAVQKRGNMVCFVMSLLSLEGISDV